MKYINEDLVVSGRVTTTQMPEEYNVKFAPGNSTPSVKGARTCIPSPGNISKFLDGQEGQIIKVLGKAGVTIVNSPISMYAIRTNIGANKLLLDDRVYTFTCFKSSTGTLYWVEDE